ncbi:MAG: PDC sensor domain-containing protein [Neoaquamicrobium sediminum]|uniref:PDC sensor domain-containing protein n=1 Tax=Neoaquamicrobium sediminum TaxID=1849104 RepID=UPI00403604B4
MRTPLAAFGLAAGLFVSVLASSALFVSQGYRDSIRRGEEKAGIAAQIVAVHFQWLIEASRQSLRRIDDTLGYRPELLATAVLGDLDDAIEGLPQNVEVRLFDRNGREILSTAPRGEINIADRPYFQELRDGAAQVISQLLIDRITGEEASL